MKIQEQIDSYRSLTRLQRHNRSPRLAAAALLGLAWLTLLPAGGLAQEKQQDPTAPSEVINKTLSKIRDVEQLDAFIQRNQILQEENKTLKQQLASIQKQLQKLTKDFEEQNAKLRSQFLQMPTFEVQSKILGISGGIALLKSNSSVIRIRNNTEMSVPVADGGGWVLMQVKNISKDMIELHFPELERTVYLYD